MFQRKPVYIVGIVLFTLLLLADLAFFFLIPGGSRSAVPSFGGRLPEGFDAQAFDPENTGPQMPGGSFDPESFRGEMPEGGFSGQVPEGGFGGQIPGGSQEGIPEGGFDRSALPDRAQGGSIGGGLLNTVRAAFWPVLIVCILGDGLCVFLLIRVSRRKEQDPQDGPEEETPRRDHTNTWLAVIALLLVGAVALSGLPTGETGVEAAAETSVLSAEAETRDLSSTFSGSGTLVSADLVEMEFPESVNITSFAVQNGDLVEAGDVIARVDKTSALKAIYEVQSLITGMDQEIAQVQKDTLEDRLITRADGRVKAIYVQTGDDVATVTQEKNAVMLISLGGSMTVVIESQQEVTVGQTLTVTLSDGSSIEGKVQQARDGKITVTTTDDGPSPDDTVTVATQEGTVLGTGTLEISSPLAITGYWGTVSQIRVRRNQKVSAGDVLLTLTDTQDQARYRLLLDQRSEMTDLIQELTALYQEGAVLAQETGIISQIDPDAAYTPLSASGNTLSAASLSSSGGYGVVLLSNMTIGESGDPDGQSPGDPPSGQDPTPPEEGSAPVLTDGAYAGIVTSVSYGALGIRISQSDASGLTMDQLAAMSESLFTVSQSLSLSADASVNQYQEGQLLPSSVNAVQAGSRVLIWVAEGTIIRLDFVSGREMPGGNSEMQMPSGGGFGGMTGDQEEEAEAVYEVPMKTLCAITPVDTMTIDISVDELDILSLAAGQEATVTLDALPGQSFPGVLRRIDPTGTNEGGSTKYNVTMEVPRTDQMLPGMNASVAIQVHCLEAVLTVPAAAVREDGTRTYVYTARNETTGEPDRPVDVITGASDGVTIQILSGLSQGDTVFYSYADSLIYR